MSDVLAAERPTDAAAPAELLLRVHGGRLDGAEQKLAPGAVTRIGHDFDNGLVLRGRGTGGIALALHRQEGSVRVQVLSGEVVLLGCAVAEGGWALLPPYVPLKLGEYAIAVGEAGSPRWAEVRALARSQDCPPCATEGEAGEESLAPSQREGVQRWLGSEAEAIGRRIGGRTRPGMLIGAAAVLAVLAAAPLASEAVKNVAYSPAALDQDLAEAGYAGLRVTRDPATEALVIEGRVTDDSEVERIRRFAQASYGPVTLNLSTMAGTAEALNGLLQSQGIDAQAQPGPQGIVVHTEFLPQDRLAPLRNRIAADLPETGPVRFVRDQRRGPRDLQYFFASERFGLASLVDGDPGHIVTADGQYWFAGSLLPTGHRLVSVGNGEIRFERDGQVESLRVASSPEPASPSSPDPGAQSDAAPGPTLTAASSTRINAG